MLYGPNRAVVVLSLQSSRNNLQLGVTEPNAKMFSFSLGSILLCFAQLPPLVQPRLTIAEKHAGSETPAATGEGHDARRSSRESSQEQKGSCLAVRSLWFGCCDGFEREAT